MNKRIIRKLTQFAPVTLICAGLLRAAGAAESTNAHAPAFIYEGPANLTGEIYAKDSNPPRLLYHFKRSVTRDGTKINVLREYTYPDGKPAAQERIYYDGNHLVSYELDELQINAMGTARVRHEPGDGGKGKVLFEYDKDLGDHDPAKKDSETLRADTLVGDMIAPFLKIHWNELARGEKVRCRYIVIPRRETVGFTFVKDGETTYDGRPVTIIRMEATSPIIASLVDPLFFTVDNDSEHGIPRYIGRVAPKARKGDRWEDLDALVLFDWKGQLR